MIQRTVIPTRVASTRPVLLVLAVLLLLRPVPAHAGQDAEDKTSPFASLRWNGDVPEVQVQGDWYRPLVIHDVGVEDILAFLERTQPSRVRKRFGEDLPQTIRNMGRVIPARVDLTLVRLADGVRVELAAVACTKANRRAIWRSNQDAPDEDRAIASRIPRARALADLLEFQGRLDDQFAYRHLKDLPLDAELRRIADSFGATVEIGELSDALHLVLMRSGDGHAMVRSPVGSRESGHLPFLLAEVGGGVVAFLPDRSGFLDGARPFVLALDDTPIEELIEAGRPWVVDGSEQLVRHRVLRGLRELESVRKRLGLPPDASVKCTLGERPDDPDPIEVELPMDRRRPTYGTWPRRDSGILDSNLGYLRIPEMSDRMVPHIRSSMADFRGTAGLVVDVRGNGGGTRSPLLALAGYLVGPDESPWVANVARYRASDRFPADHLEARFMARAEDPDWSDAEREAIARFAVEFDPEWDRSEGFSDWHYLVLGPTGAAGEYFYDRPVVVLSDAGCFSATDIFLGALHGRPRVTLIGERSGGGSARSQGFRLANSGIEVRCASMASFRPDGRLYDGRGVEVDVAIRPEPDHFLEGGRDVVLDAAVEILRGE